jgi:hypothetical protein
MNILREFIFPSFGQGQAAVVQSLHQPDERYV